MRPALVRFGVASLALVACWSDTSTRSHDNALENHADLRAGPDLAGAYWCSIEDGGYRYPDFPCEIRDVNGTLVLAKLGGSQRFEGRIKPRGRGFAFEGRFYCPWGDCTQPLHGVFAPTGPGLRGTFNDAKLVVEMRRAPDSAFGGLTYGGDGYGGFGGLGYGGATYGLPAPGPRRR